MKIRQTNVVFFVLLLLYNTYTHWFLVHIYIYMYIVLYSEYISLYIIYMVFKTKGQHHGMFRLLSSSRSNRITLEIFIDILSKIVNINLLHLFFGIGEILYCPSNNTV